MKIRRPSTTENIVNLSNSLLKNFGAPTAHPSLPILDKALAHTERLVVLLFDGNGTALQRRHLPAGAFLRYHRLCTIDSTFPPTTVAATTALLSGRYPVENGWLGWMQYFKEFRRNIDVFNNRDDATGDVVAPGNLLRERAPYDDILTQIAMHRPEVRVDSVWPAIIPNGTANDLAEFFSQTEAKVATPGPLFFYGYWPEPDSLIHRFGVRSPKVRQRIRDIDLGVKKLVKAHRDTTFVILADHGLIDIAFLAYDEHPDFAATLKQCFANESRAAFFFVKEGKQETFETLFNQYYGNYFQLITKKQMLDEHWFGEGQTHPAVEAFLGDYMAVAIDRYAFDYRLDGAMAHAHFKAHHAGLTDDEIKINVTVIKKKKGAYELVNKK